MPDRERPPADPATPDPDGVIVVLGATGGIGSALADRLTARGQPLMVCGRSEEKTGALAARLGVDHAVFDATDADAVDAALDRAASTHGPVRGVVNCVGSIVLKPAHLTTPAVFDEVVRTNLGSAFAVVRAAGRIMRNGGSVVLVATAAARAGFANHEAIAAAKGGVIGLTYAAAATYASRGLRVNAIAPGLTRTPLAEPVIANEAAERASTAMHALGRLGQPEEIAAAIDFLLGPEATWITGQVLGVDGGLSTLRPRMKA